MPSNPAIFSTAQTALAAFEKDIQSNPQGPLATALADPNSQTSKDFQALQAALQSNDPASAQSAFATLAQGLQSLHRHHRHHKADGDSTQSNADTANTSSTNSTSSLVGVNLNEQV